MHRKSFMLARKLGKILEQSYLFEEVKRLPEFNMVKSSFLILKIKDTNEKS